MKELILNLRIFELPTLFEVLQYTFFVKHNLCKHTMAEILENVSIKYNIGQKVVDKFTKLSKKGFSMECFTADFCNFLPITIKIWLLGGWLGTHHQIQAIQGFF